MRPLRRLARHMVAPISYLVVGDSPPILALRFTSHPYGQEPYGHDHMDMKHVWLAFTLFYLSFCIMDEE